MKSKSKYILFLLACLMAGVLIGCGTGCSSPMGGPDPFDVAIGEAAKQQAMMNARRFAP